MIETFPPSKAIRAMRLPPGGAGINITVPSQLLQAGQANPGSLNRWVELGTFRQNIISQTEFELEWQGKPVKVIEVTTRCCAVPPYLEAVGWFFEVGGKMFCATLTYWQGDPHTLDLRETLKSVVSSLTPTP